MYGRPKEKIQDNNRIMVFKNSKREKYSLISKDSLKLLKYTQKNYG